ncbi:MAG TPA: phosphoribosyltransferase [Nitrososphaerales archaeon]|nr:phosphoribosyltransferase [Nitrososphaerales archaeon]
MFQDREQAGKLLAKEVSKLTLGDVVVLAIPRGGVPVAKEVASTLGAPLDLVITRKIGAPGNPEFAIGAVTQDGEPLLNDETVRELRVSDAYLRRETEHQFNEIKERMKKYRGDRPFPKIEGKTVVIVDDGIATGSTTRAAIRSVMKMKPSKVVLATPVAPEETLRELSTLVDQVVCLDTPQIFYAIGEFYENFEQVEDDEVKRILESVAALA